MNKKTWEKLSKEKMVEAMGGKCSICGYNKCLSALEFHHINPEEKDFKISSYPRLTPTIWNKIVNELKKCVLVCSNCHSEIHSGITNIPEQYSSFNEQYTDFFVMMEDFVDTCPRCDNPKFSYQKYCSKIC